MSASAMVSVLPLHFEQAPVAKRNRVNKVVMGSEPILRREEDKGPGEPFAKPLALTPDDYESCTAAGAIGLNSLRAAHPHASRDSVDGEAQCSEVECDVLGQRPRGATRRIGSDQNFRERQGRRAIHEHHRRQMRSCGQGVEILG
jgi:hypothetical protein